MPNRHEYVNLMLESHTDNPMMGKKGEKRKIGKKGEKKELA